ncbi:MAG: isochorismate synthase MenF [Leucobacter sp.]
MTESREAEGAQNDPQRSQQPRWFDEQPVTAFFAGEQTVSGEVTGTLTGSGTEWADEVVRSIGVGEYAVAAIDFEPAGPGVAQLIRPREIDLECPARCIEVRHSVVERPTAEEYASNVRVALDRIGEGSLRKVVLGRGLDVISDPPLSWVEVLGGLLRDRPGRYVFSMPLADSIAAPGDTATTESAPQLIGASPELLVRRTGRSVVSLPLAGSVPRADDPVEDRERAEALLHSVKDLAEHAFVVDEIVAALAPICSAIVADPAPRLVSTDTLHHLGTQIRAELLDPADTAGTAPARRPSALHLAQLLQPTPAVGGVPRQAALDVIAELESDRGPLTGAVGWVDGNGDGEFAVTIRAGVLDGARLRLYAGAGIVAGSDPESEVRETGAKLATMLKAVGI